MKTGKRRLFDHCKTPLAIAILLLMAIGTNVTAADWDKEYKGDQTPDQEGWSAHRPSTCVGCETLSDGILTLNTTVCDSPYYYFDYWGLTDSFTCEARLKETDAIDAPDFPAAMTFVAEYTSKNQYYSCSFYLLFYREFTDLNTGYGNERFYINNYSFKTYRICLNGITLKLFVKTISGRWINLFTGNVRVYEGSGPPEPRIAFGKTGNTHYGGITHWDYVAYMHDYEEPSVGVPSATEWTLVILVTILLASGLYCLRRTNVRHSC